jgi:hypothetical protein
MSQPWKHLHQPDEIDIVAPDGTVRCRVLGYYGGSQFVIDDMKVDVRPGDEIRRMLPNGNEEAFTVLDPKFFKGHFGPHYQVKVDRSGIFSRYTGGNYNVHVSGSNSRVNISSSDQSTNTVVNGNLFNDLRKALRDGIEDENEREKLTKLVSQVEAARNQRSFVASYQALIASAANHMTIITPFLPALAEILTRHTS